MIAGYHNLVDGDGANRPLILVQRQIADLREQ